MQRDTIYRGENTAARLLWAKKPSGGGDMLYLPLFAHLSDSAEVARLIWDSWVSENIKRRIPQELFIFLAGAHDLGKASPVFQLKKARLPNYELDEILLNGLRGEGFMFKDSYANTQNTRHELVSHSISARHGLHESLCVVLSGHHGKPPNSGHLNNLKGYAAHFGFNNPKWAEAQNVLFFDALSRAGLTLEEACSFRLARPEQALLSGLVILADWIASDEALFPLIGLDCYVPINSAKRAEAAIKELDLPSRWEPENDGFGLYKQRFDIDDSVRKVRPVQATALTVAMYMKPDIMIIEAPMGEGKTEAALAAAEVLVGERGLRGVYFALPTQATSNAMFERVNAWIERFGTEGEKYSIRLSHGRAELNDTYRNIRLSGNIQTDGDEDSSAFVHEWLTGRKKGMLADFAVGTIDHVLMAGLKQKHLVLRHLGLAGKVVILDEVHAYDVYMNSYLLMALAWLGAYGVPVIVLSATLPSGRRQELLDAYTGRASEPVISRAYPLITYTHNGKVECEEVQTDGSRSQDVVIRRIGGDALMDGLEDALSGGGCAGVIVNTVSRAQQLYRECAGRFGAECVYLLHARLLACERAKLEMDLAERLGPPEKAKKRPKASERMILIGTQVIEQSLDFDFDILVSDLCPMDLLLQRIGRLHRHPRARPEKLRNAACLVLNAEGELERGAEAIYGSYLLLRTRALLPEKVSLPGDIPRLVAGVYEEENCEEFEEARIKWNAEQTDRMNRALEYQISPPDCGEDEDTLVDWLDRDADDSEKRGEAAVRDGADSVEVIVIQRRGNELYLLPWIDNGRAIPRGTPDREMAVRLCECSVRLPAFFGGKWIVDKIIKELETIMSNYGLKNYWYSSSLLKGSLCLVLNENYEADLGGYRLRYDEKLGLIHEKEA